MNHTIIESTHPVQLWVGPRSTLIDNVHAFCKRIWCKSAGSTSVEKGSCACITCRSIEAHAFYGIHWLIPEKNTYTVDQIQELLRTISFALERNEKRIIVFEAAERLSIHTAPRLLKPLEEPYPGYSFILLTESKDQVLDTIVSRTMVFNIKADGPSLFEAARTLLTSEPVDLARAYESCQNLTEHETRLLVDELTTYWHRRECDALQEHDKGALKRARAMLLLTSRMLTRLPLAGNVTYFWRTLLLHMANV